MYVTASSVTQNSFYCIFFVILVLKDDVFLEEGDNDQGGVNKQSWNTVRQWITQRKFHYEDAEGNNQCNSRKTSSTFLTIEPPLPLAAKSPPPSPKRPSTPTPTTAIPPVEEISSESSGGGGKPLDSITSKHSRKTKKISFKKGFLERYLPILILNYIIEKLSLSY